MTMSVYHFMTAKDAQRSLIRAAKAKLGDDLSCYVLEWSVINEPESAAAEGVYVEQLIVWFNVTPKQKARRFYGQATVKIRSA